ncbi:MAG: UDP-glucose--dolichyl-phosphate glucosyltransferase [Porphyromonadaceae bacterium CG2_30_38_12]|nr:MAG: UDP-glucose--dolichyl-phosphate glucosyltransferase [Porphyromonadaceae bacterium CG2_30_38_12]
MKVKVVGVIIPAYNEENAVGMVIDEIPKHIVTEIVVVNNNSTDGTAAVASQHGATVLHEKRQGYGWACLKGIEYFRNKDQKPDIIVFMDADHSDFPAELSLVVQPILEQNADLVIGTRNTGTSEKGSMTPQQIFGNWLSTKLIRLFYNVKFTDLGPFRAIKFDQLLAMKMQDKTYGWTVEMQIKAAKMNLHCVEVPVNYRQRIGVSKVSGTLKGTIGAGVKIISTILKYR